MVRAGVREARREGMIKSYTGDPDEDSQRMGHWSWGFEERVRICLAMKVEGRGNTISEKESMAIKGGSDGVFQAKSAEWDLCPTNDEAKKMPRPRV